MVLIVAGIATTAAGAIILHQRMNDGAFGDPRAVVRAIRQTTGVVLAVANFVRAALDALQLINRPVAAATGVGTGMRVIGGRSADDDD